MSDELSDEALIERFRASGEMRDFNDLVARHIRNVRSLIYPQVLNNADADDLTQEVFLRVIKNLDRFQGRSSFKTWLFRIAMNTTYSYLRQPGRKRQVESELPDDQPDTAPTPAETMAGAEKDAEISRALAALAPTLREAIVLTAIQGLKVRDAAAAADCLSATMYWRVHEGRKQLKHLLNITN